MKYKYHKGSEADFYGHPDAILVVKSTSTGRVTILAWITQAVIRMSKRLAISLLPIASQSLSAHVKMA
jgi:hypothetical protein